MTLEPEKVKPYLKLITESIVQLNNNKGSLRKDIWDYLYNKYTDAIDYRDFLLAIAKFKREGKMINNDGIFSMHDAVINEVRDKTPTPVFRSKVATDQQNMYINDMSAQKTKKPKDIKNGGVNSKHLGIQSKISNSGKRAKVKRKILSPGQSIIDNYLKKQSFYEDKPEKVKKEGEKSKLGFQTPLPIQHMSQELKSTPISKFKFQEISAPVNRNQQPVLQNQQSIHSKKYVKDKQREKQQKYHDHKIKEMSKRIIKSKKPVQKYQQKPLKLQQKKQIESQQQTDSANKKLQEKQQVEHKKQDTDHNLRKDTKVKTQEIQSKPKLEQKIQKKPTIAKKNQSEKKVDKLRKSKAIKKKQPRISKQKLAKDSSLYKKHLRGKTLNIRNILNGQYKAGKQSRVQVKQQVPKNVQKKEIHKPKPKSKTDSRSQSRSKSKTSKNFTQKKMVSKTKTKTKKIKKPIQEISNSSKLQSKQKQISKKDKARGNIKKQRIPKSQLLQLRDIFTGTNYMRISSRDRKAKLDAEKIIKQLYVNKKKLNRNDVFRNERLLYI